MTAALHVVKAAVIKVSIGANGGNRVARFVQRGDLVPAGIDAEQIARLLARGLIDVQPAEEEVEVEPVITEKASTEKLAADKAAATTK